MRRADPTGWWGTYILWKIWKEAAVSDTDHKMPPLEDDIALIQKIAGEEIERYKWRQHVDPPPICASCRAGNCAHCWGGSCQHDD